MSRCLSCFSNFDDEYEICPYCGQEINAGPKTPIQLTPGTVLANRYLIGFAVGSGGFGIIYKAYDLKLETIVAVKEFFSSSVLMTRAAGAKQIIVNKKRADEFEYRKKRFLAEARIMAQFGAHNSIPNVIEYFEENNTAYIVMELLEGVNLNKLMKDSSEKLSLERVLHITNEIGNALISLHEKNIIHRDVAPDNVFICSGDEGKVKLLDLGSAKLTDESDDVIDIILKPGYSPVEQYDNTNGVGVYSDIYALGATVYYMLTGIKPDESTNRKIEDKLVAPHEIDSNIPINVSNAVMRAMAIDKHMRFKSVNEFLLAIGGQKKVLSVEDEKKKRKRKRLLQILAATFVVTVIAGILSFTYISKRQAERLKKADITIWYCGEENSPKAEAIKEIISEFNSSFSEVTIKAVAIKKDEYVENIESAAESGKLPALFESTGIPEANLKSAHDVSAILNSPQASDCLFLNQYEEYYSSTKKIPLAIEIPIACVITKGPVAIEYDKNTFSDIDDFGEKVKISVDERHSQLIANNFSTDGFEKSSAFLNNKKNKCAVMLTSSMEINGIRETLTNYEKKFIFPDYSNVQCNFTYEWSLGEGNKDELRAAEKLLSWMLGKPYQSILMISKSNEGQIPINKDCFMMKAESKTMNGLEDSYKSFSFEKGEEK